MIDPIKITERIAPNDRVLADAAEVAAMLGMRDRVLGLDSGERASTIVRFRGCHRLESSYWRGWHEVESLITNCADYAAEHARRAMVAV